MANITDPARKHALGILNAALIDGRLMSDWRPPADLDAATRARAARLASETFRWMDRADRALGPFLRLKPPIEVLNALRLGTVSICHLNEPAHGVVNDMVGLVKSDERTTRLSGLVNAVLRKVDRGRESWSSLPPPRLPKWLRKVLVADFGKAVVADIETAHAQRPPIDLTLREDAKDWAERLNAERLPTGSLRLPSGSEVTALPGFEDGAWWVQDAAATLPVKALGDISGKRILDMCAAPGGKTMQLAAGGAKVTALDISKDRLARVRQNLQRTGLSAEIVEADALTYEAEPFDAVVLDAPCTATGTIRRHPDLPHVKDPEGFPAIFELQARLIDRALDLVRPGGALVYCTCSLLIDEGEEQVRDAMLRNGNLQTDLDALKIDGIEPDWIGPEGLRTRPDFWPGIGGMDGFFITLLRKAAEPGKMA